MTALRLVVDADADPAAELGRAATPAATPALVEAHAPAEAKDVVPAAGGPGAQPPRACASCLRRTWLIAALGGYIERARHSGSGRLRLLLALGDEELMRAVGGVRSEILSGLRRFDSHAALVACRRSGVTAVCRHDDAYPAALLELLDPPAVLHVAGAFERFRRLTVPEPPGVAVVGARRASGYGLEVARGLGRGLAAADVPVISGMALGVDSAAHAGALEVRGPTLAVLAAGADRPYPPSKRRVYEAIREAGAVVSELPPGASAHRWCFPARNRIIAALAGVTVVVEAAERSGSLITAEYARDLGREVGAVPGQVTSPLAVGANALLKDGAHVVTRAEDALDLACGVGAWGTRDVREQVPGHLRDLLDDVAGGRTTFDALSDAGRAIGPTMAGLAELELLGHVRRGLGGHYVVTA